MSSLIRACVLVGGLLVAGSRAGPVAARDVEVLPVLQERFAPIVLGTYSLATSHVNDVLFNIGIGASVGTGVTETARLEVECVDCRTWGNAVLSTTGVAKHQDPLKDIISFFKNPIDLVVSAFDLNVKLEFENVGGHFEFDIFASDTLSYSFPIFHSETLAGMAVSEDVSIGLVFFIELVFSLTAEIDLEAGFEFAFPEGAYITVDPLDGSIVDHGFTGGETNNLPIICTSGSATFKAALRVRVQAGTTIECFGTGFDFSLGIYADLISYQATIATTPACELSITESLDVDIGAYAHCVAELDYKTIGFSPAVVTTLLDVPLPSLCITRPHATIPAFPTDTPFSLITTTSLALTHGKPSSSSATPTSSTPGGIFFEGSSSSISHGTAYATATATATSSGIKTGSPPFHLNSTSTITSAASLTTSTVYATSLVTLTSCSSTVLHCPASLASEVIITSTYILYTTICPIGATLPTTLPPPSTTSSAFYSSNTTITTTPIESSSIKAVIILSTALISPLPLTPCTDQVSTIYIPTFENPTYTMPNSTSFTVPFPNWSAPTPAAVVPSLSTTTPVPVKAVYTPSGIPIKPANSTTAISTKTTPTSPAFTGGARRYSGSFAALAAGLMVVLVLV